MLLSRKGATSSDPVATLRVGYRELTSTVQKGTLAPTWFQPFALPARAGDAEDDDDDDDDGAGAGATAAGGGGFGAKAKGAGGRLVPARLDLASAHVVSAHPEVGLLRGGGARGGNNAMGRRRNAPPLEVVVDDWDQYSGNDFMGRVEIDLAPLSHKRRVRSWYPLGGQADAADSKLWGTNDKSKARGEVELALRWCYNPSLDFLADGDDGYPDKPPNELVVALVQVRLHPVPAPCKER